MIGIIRRHLLVIGILGALIMLTASVWAGPPTGKGGGNGGGGDGGDTGDGSNTSFPRFVLVDLGPQGVVSALNDSGEAVGRTRFWQVTDTNTVLSEPLPAPADASWVDGRDLNNLTEAVGRVSFPHVSGGEAYDAYYWNVATDPITAIELPNPLSGYYTSSWANSISDSGLIVGHFEAFGERAELLGQGLVVWQLGSNGDVHSFTLATGSFNIPSGAVNTAGQVVATDRNAGGSGIPQGVLYQLEFDDQDLAVDASEPILLGTLGGPYSDAIAIHDAGHVAGSAWINDEESHAVVWSVDAQGNVTPTDLGQLDPKDVFAEAVGINVTNAGELRQVVGNSGPVRNTRSGSRWEPIPFLWQHGDMANLNELVADWNGFKQLLTAEAINEDGWICGTGEKNRELHSFVAIPVP